MTYHRVCYQINTTGVTSGVGTVYPFGAPEFTIDFEWGSCYSTFSFICMLCRQLFVLLYFIVWPLCCLSFFDLRILITPVRLRLSIWPNLPVQIVLRILKRYIFIETRLKCTIAPCLVQSDNNSTFKTYIRCPFQFQRSLFVLLYFIFCHCPVLFFCDIWILITPLKSSNSSKT